MQDYNKKIVSTLELNTVLQRLSDEASMPDAKERALSLLPSFDYYEVNKLLTQTDDAYKLIAQYTSPHFGGLKNINSHLTHAALGASLSAKELLNVSYALRIIRTVKKWYDDCAKNTQISIDYLFCDLSPNSYLEDKINFAIKNEDELNDNASSALADIRRKIRNNSEKIKNILDKTVKGSASKYLQDAIITQRDGRYVVPVKAEYKGEFSGIIHDTSATGSTVFIEPMAVVEANNETRILRIKEQEEIARILAELSALVSDFKDQIATSYSSLVELDLIFAKAKLAYKMGAVMPKINTNGYIHLKNARHPLINRKNVVPITVSLGGEYNQLIITGPNTGGKTVTLKTIGLFNLMTTCGLMIPADDNSEMAIFDSVFADIGDEQSIEQSLSTFSSHMVNIISILEKVENNSLVLFDELCSGTDPIEGAALAKSILLNLLKIGAKTVATTHYPELKSYALDTEMVNNASCEFDVNTLKPTYRLIIGLPGRSNAFAISERLGLPKSIITEAKEHLSEDDTKFERVVASLEKARIEAENERQLATRLRSEAEQLRKKAEALENELKLKQEKVMEQTRDKANSIIEDARYKAGQLLNELEEAKKQINAQNASLLLEQARKDYKSTLRGLEDSANPVENNDYGEKLKCEPKIGDVVMVASLNRDADVVEINSKRKKALVVSGSMKLWVDFDDLRVKKSKSSEKHVKKTRNVSGIPSKQNISIAGEIDLRGMASDEAILELDKYIDNAVLSGITAVTIIHGKGTGVLRKAVQSYLRSHKNIKSFRIGVFGEGENGVTIAELSN